MITLRSEIAQHPGERTIVLAGFMGTGKSTVGQLVATRLGRPFFDTDVEIEQRFGKSIARIFEQEGEYEFRRAEREMADEIARSSGMVVATGGGMLVDAGNRARLLASCFVVCLDAPPERIEERLRGATHRPLAADWRARYQARREAYTAIPLHVDSGTVPPKRVAERIIALWHHESERQPVENQNAVTTAALTVQSPEGKYQIVIESGGLQRREVFGLTGRAVVITNRTLAPLYGEALAQRLDARLLTVPDGEQYKTLETVRTLYDGLVAAGADRHTVVIALGGGVLGDMAGFAAATYMRGLDFIQVPTSLLAMVDSSVGGKVGVDLPQGKNLVGAFKQPLRVIIDSDVLATLPAREWACGMAETIKHGLIGDSGLFEQIEADPAAYARFTTASAAADLVARSVQVKIDVVQVDPYERGIRAHLNLGHTFGHAVEQASGYAWPHGEGVGIGLIAAAHLSARLGLCAPELAGRVERVVGGVGLPTHLGNLDPDAIYAAMATDKKFVSGKSRFILIEQVGRVRLVEDVPRADVIAVLEGLA